MTTNISIDANIIISFISPDESNEAIDKLFIYLTAENTVIWAPALLSFEVANVLTRKVLSKSIKKSDQETALTLFYRLPIILGFNEELMADSANLTKSGVKSYYDASYIALAKSKNIPLITYDKELIKFGKKVYPAIFTPDQWLS